MTLEVRGIERKDCEEYILNIHYARRWPSISYAYGLFDKEELIGIVSYGTPPSSTLKNGLAGKEYAPNVLELNRLCLKYNRKNEASFLIAKSLKLLEGDRIIISYADASQGHIGYVYQACNFTYHGLSAKRTDWVIKGKEHLHNYSIGDMVRGADNRVKALKEMFGDDFQLKPRPRKHRYIYLVGTRKFKKEVSAKIKYKQAKYPKET